MDGTNLGVHERLLFITVVLCQKVVPGVLFESTDSRD